LVTPALHRTHIVPLFYGSAVQVKSTPGKDQSARKQATGAVVLYQRSNPCGTRGYFDWLSTGFVG